MAKESKKPYEKILELNSKIMELKRKIKVFQPSAVLQLYKMGYSMDKITIILGMGKIIIMEILHKSKIKIRKRGRYK